MDLNNENYYSKESDLEYMSYSQFKQFCECQAKAMAILNGEYKTEESDAMLIGSYVDAWLDGELDKFKEIHPEIYNSRTGELKANFKQAEELCDIIRNDELMYKLLTGERQKILTGTIAGVKFKGKIDSLTRDFIVDGKVIKDCNDVWIDGEKKPFYYANRYDIQAVVYEKLYMQNYFKELPYLLAIITKEKTPDKRLVMINEQSKKDAEQEIIAKAPIFDAMKKGNKEVYGCGCCDYCRSIKKLKLEDIEEI